MPLISEMKNTKGHKMQNHDHPNLGDPMTEMYFDMVSAVGSIAVKYPDDFNQDRMWKMIREMDAIYHLHMRRLLNEAEEFDLSKSQLEYHPAVSFIRDRLIREHTAGK